MKTSHVWLQPSLWQNSPNTPLPLHPMYRCANNFRLFTKPYLALAQSQTYGEYSENRTYLQLWIWSIRQSKTGFLPSSSSASTTGQMHHMDADEMHRQKSRQELHKKTTCYSKQNLEPTPRKTTGVRPFTPPSLKLPKLDKQDIRETAGEVRKSS